MQSLTINEQNVSFYSYSNLPAVKFPIHSIVISLHGWYETKMRTELTSFEAELAENHVLCIYPYYSEWCWMNDPTIQLIDEITDFYIRHYQLAQNIPVVIMGKSMGGLSAFIFSLYSKRTPVACAANCPICDLSFHTTERADIPRTIYSAFGHYNMPLEAAIKLHSPLHQAEYMPYIPYYIVHGNSDLIIQKNFHSDPFVKRMMELGHDVEYHRVDNMKHCDFRTCPEEEYQYHNFILTQALK